MGLPATRPGSVRPAWPGPIVNKAPVLLLTSQHAQSLAFQDAFVTVVIRMVSYVEEIARLPATAHEPAGQNRPDDLPRLRAAVHHAWRAVVGRPGASAGLTLAQAGCDSLHLLQCVLVLERVLRRPVPLDLLDTDMRAEDIVTSLSRAHRDATRAAESRPTVFLLPGLHDDEQGLARFRVGLQPHVRFVLIAYPDWPEMLRPGWQFTDLVEAVARQILQETAGEAPILLTGYSFGGDVGFAVACRLMAEGYPVRWFGILDTDITRVLQPAPGGFRRLVRWADEAVQDLRREGLHKGVGFAVGKVVRRRAISPRMHRDPRRWQNLLPARTEFWFNRQTRTVLRLHAFWDWLAASPDCRLAGVPVTLFRSELGRGPSPPDFGWAPRCPDLTIVPVPGDHHTLFASPNREVLYARYAEAVQQLEPAVHDT